MRTCRLEVFSDGVYLVSFLTIGIICVNHPTLLEHCTRVDWRFLY